MSVLSSIPWGLLVPAGVLTTLAITSGRDQAPEPATSSHYTWTTLHRHGGAVRGPMGLGVVLAGVAQRGSTIIATAPNQSFRSPDNGATWTEIADLTRAVHVAFADSGIVLAGRVGSELARSTDDGTTWDEVDTGADGPFWTVVFDGQFAHATSRRAMLRSVDRGRSWQRTPVGQIMLLGLAASGSTVIATGGAGLVARSDDRGVTWTSQWLPMHASLSGVAFADERTAVIVGLNGLILRSTDAGRTWNRVTSPARTHLRAVAFSSPAEGLAVGYWGEAVRTTDGGATWEREATGTRMHLQGVTARPGGGFLATGARETILAVSGLTP